MKKFWIIVVLALFVAGGSGAQSDSASPLKLLKTIPLPGFTGDFDHFGIDLNGDRLFLVAEAHKTLEVFDLKTGKPIHSVSGFDEPHSVLYQPDSKELFVVDGGGEGACKILNGETYQVIKSIPLHPDADPMTYDPATKYLYVASGGRDGKLGYSVLSVIDTRKGAVLGEIKMDSTNVEAMAVEKSGPRIFANVRDHNRIDVIDREKRAIIASWPLSGIERNTTMAFDEVDHRLFVVGRKPGKLAVLDSDSGKIITTFPATDTADDMYYDSARKRIYVSADGFVDVFSQKDRDHYEPSAKIPTGYRAKISLFVPKLDRYYVAAVQQGTHPASILIFSVE